MIREYLKNPPTKKELIDLLKRLSSNPVDLIRKSEQEFKDHYKGKNLSDDEWIDAMVRFPKLIERPIIIKGERAVVGRPKENIDQLV